MSNSHKNNCFYCTYCQRIKEHGRHVDWYCMKHYCLTDCVYDCKEFIHVGADNQPHKNIFKFDSTFSDIQTGIYLGEKKYTAFEIYQLIFQLNLDLQNLQNQKKLLSKGLFDMSKKYKDYEIIAQILETLER